MGFFSPDMEFLIDIYQSETTDLIEELNKYLMQAEEKNRLEADAINGIFRVVHTIKSSSAMMGMADMSTCTHHLEDLFYLFRENPSLLKGRENETFDLLYAYSDYVKDEIEQVTEEDFRPSQVTELMDRISGVLDCCREKKPGVKDSEMWQSGEENGIVPENEPKENFPAAVQRSAKDALFDTIRLQIRLAEKCQMENVRAFLLINQIKEMCSSLVYRPEDLEAEGAAFQIRSHGLYLELVSDRIGEVTDRLSSSPYVASVRKVTENEEETDEGVQEREGSERENSERETQERAASGRAASERAASRESASDKNTGRETASSGSETGQNGKAVAELPVNAKSAKNCSIPWERIVKLQEVTGELITEHTVLDSMIEKLGN
ncbi:MAG: Hpt domain-containing protein, partial [Lachnospiraceae bacterium]|nr:Hpt domain-containing protein [Lachnospiraceae bacterium]